MSSDKRYRLGTHRTVEPRQTLERVTPHFQTMGITRVANVTGLDRLGIPVFLATRPNARSVSVSQGKGVEDEAARVSAIMESAETWHAERLQQPMLFMSAKEMRTAGYRIADVASLPRQGRTRLAADTPVCWIESRNLFDDQKVWLPRELVSTDYTLPQPPGSGYFAANTNGLASGNSDVEASCHGLFEVVERDAEALWRQRPVRQQMQTGIDLDSVEDPVCRELLRQFDAASIDVKAWNFTSDCGIPTISCLATGDDNDWADPEFGAGCHPAKEIALARALTEAAQARTTYIAGSRDDVGAAQYDPAQRRQRRQSCLRLQRQHQGVVRFDDIPSCDGSTMAADLERSLQALQTIGMDTVLACDLSLPGIGISVQKIVIPGLEGAYGHHGQAYYPGERARAVIGLPDNLLAEVS